MAQSSSLLCYCSAMTLVSLTYTVPVSPAHTGLLSEFKWEVWQHPAAGHGFLFGAAQILPIIKLMTAI